jgi:hypothetical protein
MRATSQLLLKTSLFSWITVAMLAITSAVRAQEAPAAPPAVSSPATPQPATVRFKRYVITDEDGFKGMPVLSGIMPVDWTMKGGVTWKMALSPPDLIRIHWGDAQDVRALDCYPYLRFCWENPDGPMSGYNVPGQVLGHSIVIEPPADQFDAIDKVIVGMFRPDLKQAKVANKEKMPDVAKTVYAQLSKEFGPQWAIRVSAGKETFEYELNGRTVQEVASLVFEETMFRPSGLTSWDVLNAASRRAPKGQVDQLTPIASIMFQSSQFNPAWNQRLQALTQQRQDAQMQAQNDQFNAIESRISAQSAANDAQHQAYWQHSSDLQTQSENEADVQREVSPWKDSDGTTFKLPTQYGHAWSGADGTIIMNNEPSYNPNSDPNLTSTTWTPMEQTQN